MTKTKESEEISEPTAKIESSGTHTRKCMVYLLNGQEFQCNVQRNANGSQLLQQIRELLDIIEFDYFGLYFEDSAQHKYWLESEKSIKKQLKNSPWKFNLSVKFYPSDPSQLAEDVSRYYMVLQLRDNIVSGRLPCSFVTHALLGSFVVQSELGDYDESSMKGNYVSGFQFAPNQTSALEDKVIELHKTHKGLTPEAAEVAFLENVKKLPLYGVDQHAVKDSENVDLVLGVSWSGLRVYRDQVQISRFAWPRILKISYARNKYYVRMRPVDDQVAESVVGFKLPNHRAAKKLWKSSVEHHTFFRLTKPERPKSKLIRTGSTFRYHGQTQHQTRQIVATTTRKNVPKIQRTASRRSYVGSDKLKAKTSTSDGPSPPELPKKEHTTTTTTEVVTVTEEIVTEKVKEKPKPKSEVIKEVTTTEETVEVQVTEKQKTDAPKSRTSSSSSSSSSSLPSSSDEETDRLTKHQRKVHKMKQNEEKVEMTTEDGKFLQEKPPGSTGSSEWDVRLQASPAKNKESSLDHGDQSTTEVKSQEQQQHVTTTVVTTVTTEVVQQESVKKEEREESSSFSSEEEEEKEEEAVEVTDNKEIQEETKPMPLPDFVPVVEPKTAESSSSSSSSSESEDEEEVGAPREEEIVEEVEEKIEEKTENEPERMSTTQTVVHTEYHITETVIQNPHVEEVAPAQDEEEQEEPKEQEVVAIVENPVERESSSSSSSESSSSSDSESEVEETPQEVEKDEKSEGEEEKNNENNNNNAEEVTQIESESTVVTQNVITTVETKSVRVEDVVIPREDNEVHRVALTADEQNNVTVTETPRSNTSSSSSSSSSSKSSSSSSSDSEPEREPEEEVAAPITNGFKKPPIVKTEVVYVEPTQEEKPEVTTMPPVVHTETKTITYESNLHQPDVIETGNDVQLLSSQTITSETMSSVTTTHITKTVVGSVSETRVEKSIVLTADGDADLHEAMARAIKDTQDSDLDVNITKVVVHEEKVIENP